MALVSPPHAPEPPYVSSDAVVVTVEPVRVGRQHLDVPIRDLRAVKIRRRQWYTHGPIRGITVCRFPAAS